MLPLILLITSLTLDRSFRYRRSWTETRGWIDVNQTENNVCQDQRWMARAGQQLGSAKGLRCSSEPMALLQGEDGRGQRLLAALQGVSGLKTASSHCTHLAVSLC